MTTFKNYAILIKLHTYPNTLRGDRFIMEAFRTIETYRTVGTCARQILFKVENNILTSCKFINGCSGLSQALCRLTIGEDIDVIIEKLKGILCRQGTSCPDQLAKALIKYKENQEAKLAKEREKKLAAETAATLNQ